jgi:hypothetical protein
VDLTNDGTRATAVGDSERARPDAPRDVPVAPSGPDDEPAPEGPLNSA